jgi:ribonucleoside-triphosphate reductase
LDKQYLTIGLNGLNQSAEYQNLECTHNDYYRNYCTYIFKIIKDYNKKNSGKYFGHKVTFNCELVPAESLAAKNYNWDKADGYKVPEDTNLYASYIFKPNDPNTSILEKIAMHGAGYIGEYLDGGSSAHLNLSEHLSKEQYKKLLKFAADVGCQYFTFNVPNCECDDCGFIAKQPFNKCPKCGSTNISLYDRIIGYLSKIDNWALPRQIEQKTRVYAKDI